MVCCSITYMYIGMSDGKQLLLASDNIAYMYIGAAKKCGPWCQLVAAALAMTSNNSESTSR